MLGVVFVCESLTFLGVQAGVTRFFFNSEPEGPPMPLNWTPDDSPLFLSMSLNGGGDKFHVSVNENPPLPKVLQGRSNQ